MIRITILSVIALVATQAAALNVVNNCDNDIYVATYNGKRSPVAEGAIAVHTDGWFRITRYQSKNFDTKTVRITSKGTPVTNLDEQDKLVYYACALPDKQFSYKIWHSGVQNEKKDPAQECLYRQNGRWLAFEYIDKNEIVVEGLACTPAAYKQLNHFGAQARTNGKDVSLHFFKLRSNSGDSWRLLTDSGTTMLQRGLGTDDVTFELQAQGNGTYGGQWFRFTADGTKLEYSTDRRAWNTISTKAMWQVN